MHHSNTTQTPMHRSLHIFTVLPEESVTQHVQESVLRISLGTCTAVLLQRSLHHSTA